MSIVVLSNPQYYVIYLIKNIFNNNIIDKNKFVFYLYYNVVVGALVDIMSGSSYIVVKSILSKIVPRAELGRYII